MCFDIQAMAPPLHNTIRLRNSFAFLSTFVQTTMGLAFSSPKTSSTSSVPICLTSQTPTKNGPSSQSIKIPDPCKTALRRSRRLTKNNPPKVVFPTYPEAKSPAHRSYPLTPRTRAKVVVRLKPILRRSPRFSKHKFCKALMVQHYHKSAVTVVVSPPSPDGSAVTAATENSTWRCMMQMQFHNKESISLQKDKPWASGRMNLSEINASWAFGRHSFYWYRRSDGEYLVGEKWCLRKYIWSRCGS
jgi:hypothetical protein